MNKDITLQDLDFELHDEIPHQINYFNKKFISETNIISFDKNTKTIECLVESDSPFTPDVPYPINMKELQAIYNKCKELGWLDE